MRCLNVAGLNSFQPIPIHRIETSSCHARRGSRVEHAEALVSGRPPRPVAADAASLTDAQIDAVMARLDQGKLSIFDRDPGIVIALIREGARRIKADRQKAQTPKAQAARKAKDAAIKQRLELVIAAVIELPSKQKQHLTGSTDDQAAGQGRRQKAGQSGDRGHDQTRYSRPSSSCTSPPSAVVAKEANTTRLTPKAGRLNCRNRRVETTTSIFEKRMSLSQNPRKAGVGCFIRHLNAARGKAMRRSKVHAASVRLDVPLYMRVEKIAKADCRSVAQLLRKVVTDFVEQAETDKSAGADRAAA